MIEKIKNAIAKKLKGYFPQFTVYPYNPPQNMEEPCFILTCIRADAKDWLYFSIEPEIQTINLLFALTIIVPDGRPDYAERLQSTIVPQVLFILRHIQAPDGEIFITNRSGNPIDDTSYNITFNLSYEMVVEPNEEGFMEELIQDIEVTRND